MERAQNFRQQGGAHGQRYATGAAGGQNVFFMFFFHFRAVAVNLRNNCRLKAFISGDLVTFNLNKLKNSDLAVYLFSHLYFILAVSFVFRLI